MQANYYWRSTLPSEISTDVASSETFFKGLLNKADCYPVIEPYADLNQLLNIDTTNAFGVSVAKVNDDFFIAAVKPNSNAEQIGMADGMKVVQVNNEPVSYDKIKSSLKDDEINLTLSDNNSLEQDYFTVRTNSVNTSFNNSGSASVKVLTTNSGNKAGYIPFDNFLAVNTYQTEFRNAAIEYLIIDVRNNGGGRISIAMDFLSYLIPTAYLNDAIVKRKFSSNAKIDSSKSLYVINKSGSNEPRLDKLKKIYFLTPGATASASELIIAALQPYFTSNMKIIGKQTYGKPYGSELYQVEPSKKWGILPITVAFYNTSNFGN